MTSTAYPPIKSIRLFRFWLAFFAGLFGFGFILIAGGYTFSGSYYVQLLGFGLALTVALCWLIWRWIIWRDQLPRTGLEIPFALGLVAVLISLAASPDIRQGLTRAGWLVAYVVLFYFFLNVLDTDLDRWGVMSGAIAMSGLALFQAVMETYNWYLAWFQASGGFVLPPSQYRFSGLLLSSSPLMALANLFLPIVLIIIWRFRRPVVRALATLWLMIYALAFPFSSARSTWLGAGAALVIMLAFWIWEKKTWRKVLDWSPRRMAVVGLALVVCLGLAGWLGTKFLVTFASSPSHGNDPFGSSGRDEIWHNALQVWETSPWVGVGPGRFAFEYLRIEPSIPPGFWASHAHDIFLQALAEFGILGLAAWLFLLGCLIRWSWRLYLQTEIKLRHWTAALLAGLAGLLVVLVFDEITTWASVMVPAIFILAWIGTNRTGPLPVYKRFSLGWLVIPIALLLVGTGWTIWAYQPYSHWSDAVQSGDWKQAAQQASMSADRDPNFHFYLTEAGLLWSWEWKYNHDPAGLARARSYFNETLRLEPSPSWVWANLAVLDAASGDNPLAVQHLLQAIQLSPNFAPYPLALGKLYEQSGDQTSALLNYQIALSLKPTWASLDFWKTTPLRQQALSQWGPSSAQPEVLNNAFSEKARQAITAGRLDEAARLLAQSRLLFEADLDIAQTDLLLAQARQDPQAIQQAQDALQRLQDQQQKIMDAGEAFIYPIFLAGRNGIGISAVPGLMP